MRNGSNTLCFFNSKRTSAVLKGFFCLSVIIVMSLAVSCGKKETDKIKAHSLNKTKSYIKELEKEMQEFRNIQIEITKLFKQGICNEPETASDQNVQEVKQLSNKVAPESYFSLLDLKSSK